jgi:hypothetical protein
VAPGLQPPDGETKVLTGLSEVIAEMMNELKNLDFAEPETDAQKLFITTQGVVLRARIATMRRIRRSFEDALYEVDTSGDDSEDAHSYSPDDDEEDED